MVLSASIPYVDIARQHAAIKAELVAAFSEALDQGQFILGPQVEEFERCFAERCGVRFAVGVNSGTDALVLALRALGVGPGDEVITAPNSFVASASCIALVGARPVFVDVREDYNIDPGLLKQAITARTKAILPVHLTGRPADMNPILEVAQAHGLEVVEDCAQAVLAQYYGRCTGSFGQIGCFSLHPLKTLNACGDGGVLTTDDPNLYEQLRLLRNIGLRTRDDCVLWSGNSRLDTVQAALIQVKMKYVDEWTARRRANAKFYQQSLAGLKQVQVPIDQPFEKAVYHTFVIQADDRDGLREHLAAHGIGSAIHYPIPIHLHKAAAELGYAPGSFPLAEGQAKRIVSLPIFPELTEENLSFISRTIRRYYGA